MHRTCARWRSWRCRADVLPQNFVWYNTLAHAYLHCGDAGRAWERAQRAQEIRPEWACAVEAAACALVLPGRTEEARRCSERLSAMARPASDALSPLRRNNPQWRRQLENWLREAANPGPRQKDE